MILIYEEMVKLTLCLC